VQAAPGCVIVCVLAHCYAQGKCAEQGTDYQDIEAPTTTALTQDWTHHALFSVDWLRSLHCNKWIFEARVVLRELCVWVARFAKNKNSKKCKTIFALPLERRDFLFFFTNFFDKHVIKHFFLTKISSHNASVTWILDAIWLVFDLVWLIVVFLYACVLHFYHDQHVCCWN